VKYKFKIGDMVYQPFNGGLEGKIKCRGRKPPAHNSWNVYCIDVKDIGLLVVPEEGLVLVEKKGK